MLPEVPMPGSRTDMEARVSDSIEMTNFMRHLFRKAREPRKGRTFPFFVYP